MGCYKSGCPAGKRQKLKSIRSEFKLFCPDCDKSFINQQGLSVHMLCAHPNCKNDFNTKRQELAVMTVWIT